MILSERTIKILKNFSTINQSLMFLPGHTQKTLAPARNIFAFVDVEENFPQSFTIYELPKLLSILSMFGEPHIECGTHSLTIKEGRRRVTIAYASESTIVAPPKKTLTLPPTLLAVDLTADDLDRLNKSAHILKAPDVVFTWDAEAGLVLSVRDVKNSSSDLYSATPDGVVESVPEDVTSLSMTFKHEHFKMMPGAYKVTLSASDKLAIATFVQTDSPESPVTYCITAEDKDTTIQK